MSGVPAEEHSRVLAGPHSRLSSSSHSCFSRTGTGQPAVVGPGSAHVAVPDSFRLVQPDLSVAALAGQVGSDVSGPVALLPAAAQQHGYVGVPQGIDQGVDGSIGPGQPDGHSVHCRVEPVVPDGCDQAHQTVRPPAADDEHDHNQNRGGCSHLAVEAQQVGVGGDGPNPDLREPDRFTDVVVAEAHEGEWQQVAHHDQADAVRRPYTRAARVEHVHAVVEPSFMDS